MSRFSIGQVILKRYRIVEFIAAGGMGSVYKVYDLSMNVFLAMKVLNVDIELSLIHISEPTRPY